MGCCQSKNRVSDITEVHETQSVIGNRNEKNQVKEDHKQFVKANKNISEYETENEVKYNLQKDSNLKSISSSIDETSQVKEWLSLLDELNKNKPLNNYALSKKREQLDSLDNLIEFFKKMPTKNIIEKTYGIYLWITHNISYDTVSFKTKNYKPQDAESVFRNGMGVCSGYANLFKEICNKLGIECIVISGHAKGIGYKIGDKINEVNHAWNAIKVDSQWRLVESTWGSGNVSDSFKFTQVYTPYYFFTPPHVLMYSHYNQDNQFQKNIISLSDFEKLPFLYTNYHIFGLNVINSQVVSDNKNPIFIEFSSAKDTKLVVTLYDESMTSIENSVVIQRDAKSLKYGVAFVLPQKNTKYYFKMFAKNDRITELGYIGTYIINRTSDQMNFSLPSYELEYDYGIKCLSHTSQIISTDKNPLFMEFSASKDTQFTSNLILENEQILEIPIISQRDAKSNRSGIFLMLPDKNSKYRVNIFAKPPNEAEFKHLTQFAVFKSGNQMNYELPNYNIEHAHGIKLLSHNSQLIYADKSLIDFEFFLPDNTSFIADIKDPNKNLINNLVLVQNKFGKENIIEVKASIPCKFDRCFLDLFAGKNGNYEYLTSYAILNVNNNREKKDKQFTFPFNRDKLSFYILNPIEKYLEFKKEYEFKVYIKNCESVAFTEDSKWNYLIQDPENENLWYAKVSLSKKGQINIFGKAKGKGDFDCLCAYEVV